MKEKYKKAYMRCAEQFAALSHAQRAKVGAVVVKNDSIVSFGYNGMPSGWDNLCETTVTTEYDTHVKSRPEVLHAESNAICKLARSTVSSEGAAIFCTHMPCLDCAKMIYQSGITEVYYKDHYDASRGTGAFFLIQSGVKVEQVE